MLSDLNMPVIKTAYDEASTIVRWIRLCFLLAVQVSSFTMELRGRYGNLAFEFGARFDSASATPLHRRPKPSVLVLVRLLKPRRAEFQGPDRGYLLSWSINRDREKLHRNVIVKYSMLQESYSSNFLNLKFPEEASYVPCPSIRW